MVALIEAKQLFVELGGERLLSAIDLAIEQGQGLAVVGPSGSGKTTLLRALIGAVPMAGGSLCHRGRPIAGRARADWAPLRREVQLCWQAADAVLDPRWRAGEAVREAARRADRSPEQREVAELLEALELEPELLDRPCGRLSGGQQQRLALARALLAAPALLLADEPASAVDPPRAAAMHRLLAARREAGMALLLATHDLTFAHGLVHEVLVLDGGRVVERGPLGQIATAPAHATTRALVAARPTWPADVPADRTRG